MKHTARLDNYASTIESVDAYTREYILSLIKILWRRLIRNFSTKSKETSYKVKCNAQEP